MKIVLGTLPPSANKYQRMHFGVKKSLRETFAKEIRVRMLEAGRFPRQKEEIPKITLGIVVRRPGRRYDFDNFIGGLKPMIDGMRDAGYLRNDSPRWLIYDPPPVQVKGDERVEIEISEMEET